MGRKARSLVDSDTIQNEEVSQETSDLSEEIDDCCEEISVYRHRVAIFSRNWMESTILAHGLPNRSLKSWKAWQIVSNDEDIERLKSLSAPIRIYIEDVDGCAKG